MAMDDDMTIVSSAGHSLPPSRGDREEPSTLSAVLTMTNDLFGETRVYEDADPEFADDVYTVFLVECADDLEVVLQKENAWVERVQAIAPRCNYRLSIVPME
jgi:hypothetical protein